MTTYPSITKATGSLFLGIGIISKHLNAVPYLQHEPWQLLRKEIVPAVHLAGQLTISSVH